MIISKTPIRISFLGGGTDYPDYFKRNGGAILSTSISQYSYITVKKLNGFFDYNYRLSYSKLELCNNIEEIQHPAIKTCLNYLKISDGLEISYIGDLPARTGLGSSSSFTVGLLNVLYAYLGRIVSQEQLAREAIYIEQELIGERVGIQDQYAAALGGFNFFEIKKDGNVLVRPITIAKERKQELEQNLLLFYTGIVRFAHEVLEEQIEKTKNNNNDKYLEELKNIVIEGMDILNSRESLNCFGELLHKGWLLKKQLSTSISNKFLDSIYEKAINAGASGGKLLGAGGGGFFLFYVEKDKQQSVKKALYDYPNVDFKFDNDGTRIIFIA